MRVLVRFFSVIAALLVGLWALGPRAELDPDVREPELPSGGLEALADWVQGR